MKLIVLTAAILFALPVIHAFSQTAKVIELDKADAVEARRITDQQKTLDLARVALQQRIREKYLLVKAEGNGVCMFTTLTSLSAPLNCTAYKDGWSFGDFEFSDDYRFIVHTTH